MIILHYLRNKIVLINNWLNPIARLKEISKKIEVYIKRNKWLLKRYFIIKKHYFKKSRMNYGISFSATKYNSKLY